MKPKWGGWKEGIISKDLGSAGNALGGKSTEHKKGDLVRYKRYKVFESERMTWTGQYEWHYLDLNNYNLVRSPDFIIETKQ